LVLDAYSRMNYQSVLSLNPGICRIVYLDEIPVDGLTVKDAVKLKEKIYDLMERKLKEYGAAWISMNRES